MNILPVRMRAEVPVLHSKYKGLNAFLHPLAVAEQRRFKSDSGLCYMGPCPQAVHGGDCL